MVGLQERHRDLHLVCYNVNETQKSCPHKRGLKTMLVQYRSTVDNLLMSSLHSSIKAVKIRVILDRHISPILQQYFSSC